MNDWITLACPACGGNLRITAEMDQFECQYCGREHIVKRVGNRVRLEPLLIRLGRIEGGVDRSAAELALRRLNEEIRSVKAKLGRCKNDLAEARDRRHDKLKFLIASMLAGGLIATVGCALAFGSDRTLQSVGLGVLGFSALFLLPILIGYFQLSSATRKVQALTEKVDDYWEQLQELEEKHSSHTQVVERR
jgi:hypothetical protein